MPSFHVTGPVRSASGTGRASSSPQHLASTLQESVYQCPLYNFVSEMGPNSHGFGAKAAGGGPRTAPDRHTFIEGPGAALKPSHLRLCGFSPGPLGVTLFLYVFSSVTQ